MEVSQIPIEQWKIKQPISGVGLSQEWDNSSIQKLKYVKKPHRLGCSFCICIESYNRSEQLNEVSS